ncbi:PGF-pre-PGF domain-containing protein [Natronorubrum sp. A-ect3]|uniref:PGF-pre-PGF domain-containing protein n=1 Tax=Natronorubrum sp. A-ect3 TaxID=3242698 RepID=UPI00359D890F
MNTNSLAAVAVALLLVLSGVGGFVQLSGANTDTTASTPTDSYVVEQGDSCYPIEPLSTNGTVESFYDYRNHETHPEDVDRMYSSYGTEHLQEDDTSILFLHEGTDGLSLVMVHDQVDGDTEGGAVTFDIAGLPSEAEWVVQDDLYDGETNMATWDSGDGWASASWIWSEARTDGGAIQGGLNDEFAVTIQPAFNEDAEHYDNEDLYDPEFHGDGEIEDWEVLSGDADDPDRTALPSLEEPVTIRTGTCDTPSVSYDRTDDGTTANIQGASVDDRIALQPTAGTDANVTFETVELTGVEDSGSITFEDRQPDGLPDAPDDVESLSYLTMSGESTQDTSATITFSVEAEYLEQQGLSPEDITLYEADGGDWVESETAVTSESGSAYQFTAEVSSLEGVTVTQQPASESAIPGFEAGIAAAVIALLAALWAVRGRDR